jgi:hypothetical protein
MQSLASLLVSSDIGSLIPSAIITLISDVKFLVELFSYGQFTFAIL